MGSDMSVSPFWIMENGMKTTSQNYTEPVYLNICIWRNEINRMKLALNDFNIYHYIDYRVYVTI